MPRPGRGGGEGERGRGQGRDRPRAGGGRDRRDRESQRPEPERRPAEPEPQRSEPEPQRSEPKRRAAGADREQRAAEPRPERDPGPRTSRREAVAGRRREQPTGAPARPQPPGHREDPAVDDGPAGPPQTSIAVGATQDEPELVETVPIATAPGSRHVVLSLGPGIETETPLPELAAGDRLLAFAELELTTDAPDPNHPGLIGNAYSYAPNVSATLVLAPGADAVDGIELSKSPWRRAVTHELHHAVVTFGDAEARIPKGGLPWQGPPHVNLVVDVSHPDAKPGDVILVGQNEKTPVVDQDMAGIRVVRFRPGEAREPAAEIQGSCLCVGVPIAKRATVVLSHELADLQAGEQLLVRGELVTDADALAAPARITTRMFLAQSPGQADPARVTELTWKGQLSKPTGFNCIPGEGPQTSNKYGVAIVRTAPGRSLYVNLVAVSAAPFGGNAPTDELPIDTGASALRITRFPPAA